MVKYLEILPICQVFNSVRIRTYTRACIYFICLSLATHTSNKYFLFFKAKTECNSRTNGGFTQARFHM